MSKHSFATLPSVTRRRSRFYDPWNKLTTMSVGKLYPIKVEEVVPGDDFSEDISFVSRLTSAYLRPVMDDLYMDVYAFFVPGRILYDGYEGVFGNPSPSAYTDNELGSIPTLPSGTVVSKSVGDYLGLPVGSVPAGLSVLPFRGFAMIWNEWFRNENTNDEVFVQTGETASSEVLNSNGWIASNYMGSLPSVGKIKDYFTSAVPQPQKGAPVSFSVANFPQTVLPVVTTGSDNFRGVSYPPLFWQNSSNGSSVSSPAVTATLPLSIGQPTGFSDTIVQMSETLIPDTSRISVFPSNLTTTIPSTPLSSISVDELRLATQRQLMLVADTMYGSRYREYIYGHYGVKNGDGRMQVPEYLCGKRIPLNVQQVAQTSAGTEDSPLAALGGYSYTVGSRDCKYFHGFTEHGYVYWVACIRQRHTYQQGISKMWSRTVRDDFYDPLYAHIGYQPIYTSELYASGQTSLRGDIFGWTEAWSEYKHTPREISGEARSAAEDSLDIYHFADYYSSAPVIGAQFNNETPIYVDRTIAVPSTSQDQFIVDFHCESYKTRVMPLYCEPGYMDHWNK